MSVKIFIDGKEGTTGLKIFERFANRSDIEILQIDEEKRKDSAERAKMINSSDFTFLCLPDAAAVESAELCTNPDTVIIDASTAHRTNPKNIAKHIVLERQKASDRNPELDSPRLYALTQAHKHLPEMKKIAGLEFEPVFNPYVCDYFQGMTVTVGLHARLLAKKVSARDVWEMMGEHYKDCNFVKVAGFMGEGTLTEQFIAANTLAGTNNMQIFVYGNDDRIMLTSRFDNLGKGASGAAVQCLNIRMGIDETTSLV